MKKVIIVVFPVIIIVLYSFETNTHKKQQNYWPIIKGKWYFNQELPNSYITTFIRQGASSRLVFDFISRDSCTFRVRGFNDVYKTKNYTYISQHDSILFFSSKDTMILKLLLLTNEEFKVKPLYP